MNASSGDPTAAACRYLLVMLLQRLEAERPGLVAEMRAGVEGDRGAAIGGRDVEGRLVWRGRLRKRQEGYGRRV